MLPIVIIGAGPAGLAAAWQLARAGKPVVVLEQDPALVGGLSRTVPWNGCRFDIGGHRFFTKSKEVENFWRAVLGTELIECKRLSRIFYEGKFFTYPLELHEVLGKLGPIYATKCLLSFLGARFFPRPNTSTYEDWMINNFGEVLFNTFFRSYTEKVWGLPCHQISSDWAAQRTRGVSVWSLISRWLRLPGGGQGARSLIQQFYYPRLGAGQLWETAARQVTAAGGRVDLGCSVERIEKQSDGSCKVSYRRPSGGAEELAASHVISTIPLPNLVAALRPAPPTEVLDAARTLRHRDFIQVVFKVKCEELFRENWIYVHDPRVRVGRIQNFNNWSKDLVQPGYTLLGLEYFCFKSDPEWTLSPERVIEEAWGELCSLRIVAEGMEKEGTVLRVPAAYPIYDHGYQPSLKILRRYLNQNFPALQTAGRNGTHRYNNQDHSVMTGFLAAKNVSAMEGENGSSRFDVWRVNEDAVYLEEQLAFDAYEGPEELLNLASE